MRVCDLALAAGVFERQNGREEGKSAKGEPSVEKRPVHVSLVVFPQSDPSILYGVFDTLWAAGRLWNTLRGLPPGEPLFVPRIVAARRGPVELATGVTIVAQDGIDDVAETDVVFVPNVLVNSGEELRGLDRRVLGWIESRYRAGADLYASCGGPLALAEAGLLDGLQATTHWGYADLFRQQFPRVTLHPDRLLVEAGPDPRIVCSGGASSWQDLVLYLVTRHVGAEEAIRLSKIFLYQWHREGQLPYACMVRNVTNDDSEIRAQQVWLAENYHRPNLVAELVRRSNLPERTFTRRFKSSTGYTPIGYIQALRVEEAKQMLETTDLAVDRIAHEVGYEDIASFRRLFRRLTGMTPADYRRKFRPPSHAQHIASRQVEPAG